nr:hypothetical protein [Spirochaetales bacterium]
YGRNRRFGREIILKNILSPYQNIEDLIRHIGEIGYLPEGAVACKAVMELAQEQQLKMPISQTVFRILNREEEPFTLIEELLKTITRSTLDGLWASSGESSSDVT